jgi:CarD family transcriptional regulator
MHKKAMFKLGDRVVYPSHGVGEILEKETQMVGDTAIEVFVISFTKEKMVLRVPVKRAEKVGLRPLSNKSEVDKMFAILRSRPKTSRGMWSKRAQEFEHKINSGDLIAVAEVVRDLYKDVEVERSYSERIIYESAVTRLACEYAAIESINQQDALEQIILFLQTREAA